MRAASLVAALIALVAGCAPPPPADLVVTLSQPSAPADGLSRVAVTASAPWLGSASVVSFALAGPGLLSSTQVRVQDGVAAAAVFAPFESELSAGAAAGAVSATVSATVLVDAQPVSASAAIEFTVPEDGAPVLLARATPDRVRAGSADRITLVIEGRRLTDAVVALDDDSDAVELPQSLPLEQRGALFVGEVTIAAPPTPATVEVRVSGGGAPPAVVALRFFGDGEAGFDLNGTFAQVSYSVVEIGGLIFLNPDPQCVQAPSLALVRVEQSGMDLITTAEICDMKMPDVQVHILGTSRSHVDPSFIRAMNDAGSEVLEATLAPDGSFSPDVAAFAPSVLGAELDDPSGPLPTAPDDPRVRDADGDGHPGVTVHNSTQGDQYTVSRSRLVALDGHVRDSDAIDAVQSAQTDSVILNGDNGGLSPVITPMPSPSHLRRVDGRNGAPDIAQRDGDATSISCADVRAYAAELMAAAPPPNTATACQ